MIKYTMERRLWLYCISRVLRCIRVYSAVVVNTQVNDTFAITLKKNEYSTIRLKIAAMSISDCKHVEPGRCGIGL